MQAELVALGVLHDGPALTRVLPDLHERGAEPDDPRHRGVELLVAGLLERGIVTEEQVSRIDGRLGFAGVATARDPEGIGPRFYVQEVPEDKVAKNRIHLDVQVGGGRGGPWEVRWTRVIEAVERLTAAGAVVIERSDNDGVPDHMVMADPEGNEFCVV